MTDTELCGRDTGGLVSVPGRWGQMALWTEMNYQSGEDIRKGDKVLFQRELGEIEFVVDKLVGDIALDWHLTNQGPGVMVLEANVFGRAFLCDPENVEDLQFLSRG